MTAKKKQRPRTERRDAERAAGKLVHDRARLATLLPGGAPERPIQVTSASEVEIEARSLPCIQCGGGVRVDEHLAQTIGAARLRIARVSCSVCGSKRDIYFRIGTPLPN